MATLRPLHSKEDFARRGDEIYERDVRPRAEPGRNGQFAAIDIESGEFEVDSDERSASDRLLERVPGAQIWVRRVGSRFARRFGARPRTDRR